MPCSYQCRSQSHPSLVGQTHTRGVARGWLARLVASNPSTDHFLVTLVTFSCLDGIYSCDLMCKYMKTSQPCCFDLINFESPSVFQATSSSNTFSMDATICYMHYVSTNCHVIAMTLLPRTRNGVEVTRPSFLTCDTRCAWVGLGLGRRLCSYIQGGGSGEILARQRKGVMSCHNNLLDPAQRSFYGVFVIVISRPRGMYPV